MLKRILFILFALSLLVICNCDEVGNNKNLSVPFHAQEAPNFCGIACIQMWSEFDFGTSPDSQQVSIANQLGVGFEKPPVQKIARGVSWYTKSEGYLAVLDAFKKGSQGDLVSAIVAGINDSVPAITTYIREDHVAIIKGAEWNDQEIVVGDERRTRPMAVSITVHDPDGSENVTMGASVFKSRFVMSGWYYWAILGWEYYLDIGTEDHDTFVFRLGTYYGGPMIYDPKKILPPDTEIF